MAVAARGLGGLLDRTIGGRGKAIRYRFSVTLPEGEAYGFDQVALDRGRLVFETDGMWHNIGVTADETGVTMAAEHRFPVAVLFFERALLGRLFRGGETATEIGAPVPGLVVEGLHPKSSHLKRGEPAALPEAMKLRQTVSAPCAGELASSGQRSRRTPRHIRCWLP